MVESKKVSYELRSTVRFCHDRSLDAAAIDKILSDLVRHGKVKIGMDGKPCWTAKGKAVWDRTLFAGATEQVLACAVFLALQMQQIRESLYLFEGYE